MKIEIGDLVSVGAAGWKILGVYYTKTSAGLFIMWINDSGAVEGPYYEHWVEIWREDFLKNVA